MNALANRPLNLSCVSGEPFRLNLGSVLSILYRHWAREQRPMPFLQLVRLYPGNSKVEVAKRLNDLVNRGWVLVAPDMGYHVSPRGIESWQENHPYAMHANGYLPEGHPDRHDS